MANKRFVKTTATEIGEEENSSVEWWYDMHRPYTADPDEEIKGLPFVTVMVYKDRDPNNFVRCENMGILYNDQAEYYFVCSNCRQIYAGMQFRGGTKRRNYREISEAQLKKHQETKGWCQFCDPVFGNGGWSLNPNHRI